ncbi:MAG: hypothetical protein BWY31_00494 [Lentisphaerae bacterium ADurb.Bin242]|nr:MAG: hypothetical protein BWY31_00494 [Lentisphaerae bacterium ADurb.Bin242]
MKKKKISRVSQEKQPAPTVLKYNDVAELGRTATRVCVEEVWAHYGRKVNIIAFSIHFPDGLSSEQIPPLLQNAATDFQKTVKKIIGGYWEFVWLLKSRRHCKILDYHADVIFVYSGKGLMGCQKLERAFSSQWKQCEGKEPMAIRCFQPPGNLQPGTMPVREEWNNYEKALHWVSSFAGSDDNVFQLIRIGVSSQETHRSKRLARKERKRKANLEQLAILKQNAKEHGRRKFRRGKAHPMNQRKKQAA